ncbi:MAG: ADP-ribosylglycohydrolase family protein [Polyangia bacterium]|jgi:poly(ADP-ribose) glycohydrolase ARH3|nr:ADP-ribosylglycohydrolase family protein [Polyangia bacterium]
MLGTLVGDSLGMPAEGMSREELKATFGWLDSLREGPLPAGEYTDDTEMAINLCESLLEVGSYDQKSVAERLAGQFTPWRGYSPHVYGIMARIRQGLAWELPGNSSFGADAASRVAALGVLYADDKIVAEHGASQAAITHTHPNGIAGSVAQAVAVSEATSLGLFESTVPKEELLKKILIPVSDVSVALCDALERMADIKPSLGREALASAIARVYSCDGGAVTTVPAALAAFLLTEDFESAVLTAVNCGGKTDVLGALAGALAGAFYGASAIPSRLTSELTNERRGKDHVIALGEKLGALTRERSGARLEPE